MTMSDTTTKAPKSPTPAQHLDKQLLELKRAGFDLVQPLAASADEAAAIVWGRHEGVLTPRILVLAVPPMRWDQIRPEPWW